MNKKTNSYFNKNPKSRKTTFLSSLNTTKQIPLTGGQKHITGKRAQGNIEKEIVFTFFCFVPHDPFQIHTGPRFTGPKTLGLCHYSNFTGIDTHGTSPHQKLFNRGCNIGCSRGKVGGQNLRRETAGNRRWRRWHCKQGVNLKDRQAYCSGAAAVSSFQCNLFTSRLEYITLPNSTCHGKML